MMYEVFGARFYADGLLSYKYYDTGGVTAGDWVRIDWDSHSIFITKVTSSGIYYTDGNGTGVYNQVRWDGYLSWSEFRNRFTYRIHLPGNSLTGEGISHTIAYNANGGSGSMSSQSIPAGDIFTIKDNGFSRSGYSFAGYIVKRSSDNTWFTVDAKWQSQTEIYNNGYRYGVYDPGESYYMSANWLSGATSSTTFTFYAQWLPDYSTVEYMSNYSGYNYILGSDLGSDYDDYIFSRDSSTYSVSVDKSERLNNANSLKITGKYAGDMGEDLAIITSTNRGIGDGYSQTGSVGDDKILTFHFYAKASVDGANMYIRWGYSTEFISVSLTKSWRTYSVRIPKNRFNGCALHPYFDKAGTYYLNSLALGDDSATTNVVPETGTWAAADQTVKRGGKLSSMPTPVRDGYVFLGWYTAAEGGRKVTADSAINESTVRLYAHWRKSISYDPVDTVRYNGHVYELYDNQLGWEDAARFCSAKGGHLLTIGSEDENIFAYSMISDRQGYCWLGLRYLHDSDSWEWVDDTSLTDYDAWYDDSFATTDTGEYYALLYPMNFGAYDFAGTWDKCRGSNYYSSYYCYYNSFFICEYDDPVFRGDADGNGEIESLDAAVIQRSSAGLPTRLPEDVLMRGDVDGNGVLEIIDSTFVQRYLASMAIPYDIGEWLR